MSALERLGEALDPAHWKEGAGRDDSLCVEVDRSRLKECLTALRDSCGFETNTFVTAIDHSPARPRFEVCYQLLSLEHNDRIRVSTRVGEEDATLPTVVDLWPGAAYAERECFDMFGIVFQGHTGLKRLMMPDGFTHHPLRKDFPHQGIEPDRLYREWERERLRTQPGGAR